MFFRERRARSFINKSINEARTPFLDDLAKKGVKRRGEVPADSARLWAQTGSPGYTASYLHLASSLPAVDKGRLLADAYTSSAEESKNLSTRPVSTGVREVFLRHIRVSDKIAKRLGLAARWLQKP